MDYSQRINWLKTLQVGDRVVVDYKLGLDGKVLRITPTQIVVEFTNRIGNTYPKRYLKRNGREIGASGFYQDYLLPYTAEYVQSKGDRQDRKALAKLLESALANVSKIQIDCARELKTALEAALKEVA